MSRVVEKRFILDAGARFSHSTLWDLMSKYYDTQGAKAWSRSGQIPSYITSNAFIASQYADVIAAFVLDTCRHSPDTATAYPFYVVELGSGHGKFTFLMLQRLAFLWDSSIMSPAVNLGARVCVVCTDIARSNIEVFHPLAANIIPKPHTNPNLAVDVCCKDP